MKKILSLLIIVSLFISSYSQSTIYEVVKDKYENYEHHLTRGNLRLAEKELNDLIPAMYAMLSMLYNDAESAGTDHSYMKAELDSIFGKTFQLPSFSYSATFSYDSVSNQIDILLPPKISGIRDTISEFNDSISVLSSRSSAAIDSANSQHNKLSVHSDSINNISSRSITAMDSAVSQFNKLLVHFDSISNISSRSLKANDSIAAYYNDLSNHLDSIINLRSSINNVSIGLPASELVSDTVYAKNATYTSFVQDAFEYPIKQIMPTTVDSGMGSMNQHAYFGFKNYDFGDGLNTVDIWSVGNPNITGGYEVILNDPTNTPFKGFSHHQTGWSTEAKQTVYLDTTIKGVHDVYLRSQDNGNGIIYWLYFYNEVQVDNTKPTITNASISNETPKVLNLTTSESVNFTTSGFSFAADSGSLFVSSVTNSGTNKPVFNLNRQAEANEDISMSYNSSIGNSVDLNGNELAPFTGFVVNNNVLPSTTYVNDTIFSQTFSDNTAGSYPDGEFNSDWNNPSWRNDKATIVDDAGNNRLQTDFPDGSFGWITGDATVAKLYQWPVVFTGAQEYVLEYDVYIDDDFGTYDYAGKLPGLAANGTPGGGYYPETEASFRYMFHGNEDGTVRIHFYMYYPGMYNTDYYNDSEPIDGKNYYGQGRTLASVSAGGWYNIKQIINLGTPSSTYEGGNGWVEGYIDGDLKVRQEGLWLRKTSGVKLDRIFFSNFFGGSGIEAQANTYMQFDNFYVYADSVSVDTSSTTQTTAVSELTYADVTEISDVNIRYSSTLSDSVIDYYTYRGYIGFTGYEFDQVDTLYVVYSNGGSQGPRIRFLKDHWDYWTPQGTHINIWEVPFTGSYEVFDTATVVLGSQLNGVEDLYLTTDGTYVDIYKIYFSETTILPSGGDTTTYADIINDDFTYTNGSLSGEANWTSSINDYTISSNQVYPTNSNNNGVYYSGVNVPPDQWAQVEIAGSVNSVWNGVGVRMSSNNYYGLHIDTDTWYFGKLLNGSWNTFQSGSHTTQVGDSLKIEAVGTTIKAFINGSLVSSQTDESHSTGQPGLTGYNSNASSLVDNFKADSISSSDTVSSVNQTHMSWGTLANQQKFVMPENASTGDSIEIFYKNFTYTNDVAFSLVSADDAFAINPNTGMLYVANSSNIDVGDHSITVQVTNTESENYYGLIKVIGTDSCVFVDPSAGSGGTGAKASPYDSWNDVTTFQAGYGYFQKRGTTESSNPLNIDNDRGTASNYIWIGSYGTGDRPVIDGTNFSSSPAVRFNTYQGSGAQYVNVIGLKVQDCEGFEIETASDHYDLNIYNCEATFCVDNANIYIKPSMSEFHNPNLGLYNIQSYTSDGRHGVKAHRDVEIINGLAYNNSGSRHGFSVSDKCTLTYVYSVNNQGSGIELQGDSITVERSFAGYDSDYPGWTGNWQGILHDQDATGDGWENLVVKHSDVSNNRNNGIAVNNTNTYIIQNVNTSNNAASGISIYGTSNNGTLDTITVDSEGTDGISISGSASDVTADEITITNSGSYGLDVSTSGNNIIFTNTSFANNTSGDINDAHTGTNFYVNGVEYTAVDLGPTRIYPQTYGFGTETRGAFASVTDPEILIVDTLYAGNLQTGTNRGSFEWAIAQNYPRVIVFEVGGIIDYETTNTAAFDIDNDYVSIYGATAPSPGITLRGVQFAVRKTATNVFVSHIAIRFGDKVRPDGTASAADAVMLGGTSSTYISSNIVFKNCSFSWSQDEMVSIINAHDVTFTECIFADPLYYSNHVVELDGDANGDAGRPEGHPLGFLGYVNDGSIRNNYNHAFYKNTNLFMGGRMPRFSMDSIIWANNYGYGHPVDPTEFDGSHDVIMFWSNAFYPTPGRASNTNLNKVVDYHYDAATTWFMNDDQQCVDCPSATSIYDMVLTGHSQSAFEGQLNTDINQLPSHWGVQNLSLWTSSELKTKLQEIAGIRPWDRDYIDSVIIERWNADQYNFINSPDALPARAYNMGPYTNYAGHWWSPINNLGDMELGYDFSSDPQTFSVNGTSITLNTNLTSAQQVVDELNNQLPAGTEAIIHPHSLSYWIIIQTTAAGSSEQIVISADIPPLGIPAGTYSGSDSPYGNYMSHYTSTKTTHTIPLNPTSDDDGDGWTNIEEWVYEFEL